MLLTELGIQMAFRLVQPAKASEPISVTELGIEIDLSSVSPLNWQLAIFVTESDNTMDSMGNSN